MNKWVASGIVSYCRIKNWTGKDGKPDTRNVEWTMSNQVGNSKNFYNLKSWNNNIINSLKDGMEIELLHYEIRVSSWQDENTLEKKKFVYFLVKEIKIISESSENSEYGVVRDKENYVPNDYIKNQNSSVDYNKDIEDEIVPLDWNKKELEEKRNENLKILKEFQVSQDLEFLEKQPTVSLNKHLENENISMDQFFGKHTESATTPNILEETSEENKSEKDDNFEVADGW